MIEEELKELNMTLDAFVNFKMVPPAIHDLEDLDKSDLDSVFAISTTTGTTYSDLKNLFWDPKSSSIWFNTTRNEYPITVQLNAHMVCSMEFKGTVGPTKY